MSKVIYAVYNGNGNVSELISANDGIIAGHYEYDPFGKTIAVTGYSLAKENVFCFSTKYVDEETGLIYYGYRYYSPEIGRWLSRDPIGEQLGGCNLYAFVGNSPHNWYDLLGLTGDPMWMNDLLNAFLGILDVIYMYTEDPYLTNPDGNTVQQGPTEAVCKSKGKIRCLEAEADIRKRGKVQIKVHGWLGGVVHQRTYWIEHKREQKYICACVPCPGFGFLPWATIVDSTIPIDWPDEKAIDEFPVDKYDYYLWKIINIDVRSIYGRYEDYTYPLPGWLK